MPQSVALLDFKTVDHEIFLESLVVFVLINSCIVGGANSALLVGAVVLEPSLDIFPEFHGDVHVDEGVRGQSRLQSHVVPIDHSL